MNLSQLQKSLKSQLTGEALAGFLKEVSPVLVNLGQDELEAIFRDTWFEFFPLPNLPVNLSEEDWLLLETAVEERATASKLCSKAMRKDANDYKKAKEKAVSIIGNLLGVVGGALSTAILA